MKSFAFLSVKVFKGCLLADLMEVLLQRVLVAAHLVGKFFILVLELSDLLTLSAFAVLISCCLSGDLFFEI